MIELMNAPLRFVAHGKRVQAIAERHGWRPGARYTNLRDVRNVQFKARGFLDIHWKEYSFEKHLHAVRQTLPLITVARDVLCAAQLEVVLAEAQLLGRYSQLVVVVPKDPKLSDHLDTDIPKNFLLGYSVPTRYGGTPIPAKKFKRAVHLLGGRPDVQRKVADMLPVYSFDCNRFTLDAAYGDHFDGTTFRPLKNGGYERCLESSIQNINALWTNYRATALL